ncbi:MAG: type II toxin-antitoxin system RelE/ParE family toxin [Desulfatirhabdiaceae bacterium]|nr:type II toxin-antitoxin system RelE/ParE family toxin [Desulfatirhabdiaceae bacterium]
MAFKVELHPEAVRDFDALDGSVRKKVAKKVDALSQNPFLGKPLGNKSGMDLTGFFKLYAAGKKYRIVYRLLKDRLEVVEIIGIGKREKEAVYKLVIRRLQDLNIF